MPVILDEEFDYMLICPETELSVTEVEHMHCNGVCRKCGHISDGTITHAEKRAVKKVYRNRLFKFFGMYSGVIEVDQ